MRIAESNTFRNYQERTRINSTYCVARIITNKYH